jgi:Zn-dependent protease
MARDSRADIIDDDPFHASQPEIPRIHAQRDAGGTIHFNLSREPNSQKGMWGIAFQQPAQMHEGGLWHFSEEERRHLLLATGAFTLALGLMRVGGIYGLQAMGSSMWLFTLILSLPVMLIAVGPAFILHEIGHKIVAKYYGCWAEFRSDPRGLKMGVGISALLGVVFMAPGAVMVAGSVTRRQNGHIAIAGPLVNLSLFFIGIPIGGLILVLMGANTSTAAGYLVEDGFNWQPMVWDAISFWIGANLILGLFNMLPFGPLDGLKVKDWNEGVWLGLLLVFSLPVILWVSTPWAPMDLVIGFANLF